VFDKSNLKSESLLVIAIIWNSSLEVSIFIFEKKSNQ